MNIPEGYMENAQGHLVPVAQVRPIDKARDEFVKETVAKAREVQRIIRDFKRESMSGISAFVQLSAERYGAKIGGEKGNVTLETYDRKLRLVRQVSETLAFDEGLMAAKALIDECLSDWCEQAPGELRAVVEQAFRVNKEGRINTNAVLALRMQPSLTLMLSSNTCGFIYWYEIKYRGRHQALYPCVRAGRVRQVPRHSSGHGGVIET